MAHLKKTHLGEKKVEGREREKFHPDDRVKTTEEAGKMVRDEVIFHKKAQIAVFYKRIASVVNRNEI